MPTTRDINKTLCIVRPANRDWACQTERCHIHCQIRLVYSKSGVIAYVRFTRATNWSVEDKGDLLYTLAFLVNVYL